MAVGTVLQLAPGVTWLAYLIGWEKAIAGGLMPFLAGAVVKLALAACVSGFAWINFLIAMLVFSLGLMGLASAYARMTTLMTQDQNLLRVSQLANSYWAVVQANPAVVTTAGTFTSENINDAPAALRPWLTQATSASGGMSDLTVTLTTGNDAALNTACATTGCSVTLQLGWAQAGDDRAASFNRSQTFYFQFGLQ